MQAAFSRACPAKSLLAICSKVSPILLKHEHTYGQAAVHELELREPRGAGRPARGKGELTSLILVLEVGTTCSQGAQLPL